MDIGKHDNLLYFPLRYIFLNYQQAFTHFSAHKRQDHCLAAREARNIVSSCSHVLNYKSYCWGIKVEQILVQLADSAPKLVEGIVPRR